MRRSNTGKNTQSRLQTATSSWPPPLELAACLLSLPGAAAWGEEFDDEDGAEATGAAAAAAMDEDEDEDEVEDGGDNEADEEDDAADAEVEHVADAGPEIGLSWRRDKRFA
jgi:hypothetical protein